MTKEELIKNQFPNDEFLQSGVLQIVDKCTAELEKENAELKKSCQIQVDSAFQMIYEKDDQLTKAKEIIKKLYAVYYDPCVTESDLKYRDELFAEIKQFLNSEVNK